MDIHGEFLVGADGSHYGGERGEGSLQPGGEGQTCQTFISNSGLGFQPTIKLLDTTKILDIWHLCTSTQTIQN